MTSPSQVDSKRWSIAPDALLFSLLIAAYLPTRFIIVLPPIIPGDAGATALLVFTVGCYWALDLIGARSDRAQRLIMRGKWLLMMIAIGLIVLAPTILIILLRHQTAPYLNAHDGMIQNEIAVRMVLAGKNPYAETYYNTPLAQAPFHLGDLRINPALEHYAYLPFTFLMPLPLQAIIEQGGGWFDQRFVHLILFAIMILAGTTLTVQPSRQLMLVMALSLNPLFVAYFIEGRNDVMVLSLLIVSFALMRQGRIKSSAWVLALACATKHPAWVLVPLYFIYASGMGTLRQRLNRVKAPLLVFAITAGVIVAPWLVMNPAAFTDDVVGYLVGATAISYPISGMGFGAGLLALGLIRSPMDSFPFWIFQLAIGLPMLVLFGHRQWQQPRVATLIAGSALLLFVVQFFSRLFNDNYLGLIIALMSVAVLIDD